MSASRKRGQAVSVEAGGPAGALHRVVRWSGRLLVAAAVAMWAYWLGWRLITLDNGIGVAVLVVELAAFTAAALISAALWNAPRFTVTTAQRRSARRGDVPLPTTMATALGLDESEVCDRSAVGADDTGEVAWARHGLSALNPWSPDARTRSMGRWPSLANAAWSAVAVEGIRRMVFAVVLVIVLLTGWFPFDADRSLLMLLVASQLLLTCGHFLLSDGLVLPGARLRWSMASVGAGLGDGTSRTGLPIRWTSTLATMVALNVAVALRGLSDRWTHGLGPMDRDVRVVAMAAAAWLVCWGFVALRSLAEPDLGYYGATQRLEETSTRRLALGATLGVAALGLVAGVLPGSIPA